MSCPDLPLLSQLLDGELAPAEASWIPPHVDTCAACQARVERLARAAAAARALVTSEPPPAPRGTPDPDCLPPDQLAGWSSRALPPDELRTVELHLERCDRCLYEALAADRVMTRLDGGPTLAVPTALEARVASRWAAAPAEASLTSLVIRVARAGVALLERHVVAPVLDVEAMPPAAPAVRAEERTESVSFRIRAPEAQIRATVVADGDTAGLTLTLLGNADEVLGGQRVFLRQHGRLVYSARTDAAGTLAMPRIERGVYEVSCPGIGTSFRLDLR